MSEAIYATSARSLATSRQISHSTRRRKCTSRKHWRPHGMEVILVLPMERERDRGTLEMANM